MEPGNTLTPDTGAPASGTSRRRVVGGIAAGRVYGTSGGGFP